MSKNSEMNFIYMQKLREKRKMTQDTSFTAWDILL